MHKKIILLILSLVIVLLFSMILLLIRDRFYIGIINTEQISLKDKKTIIDVKYNDKMDIDKIVISGKTYAHFMYDQQVLRQYVIQAQELYILKGFYADGRLRRFTIFDEDEKNICSIWYDQTGELEQMQVRKDLKTVDLYFSREHLVRYYLWSSYALINISNTQIIVKEDISLCDKQQKITYIITDLFANLEAAMIQFESYQKIILPQGYIISKAENILDELSTLKQNLNDLKVNNLEYLPLEDIIYSLPNDESTRPVSPFSGDHQFIILLNRSDKKEP